MLFRSTEEINTLLDRETFRGSVISQQVSVTDELKALSEQYGISAGKVKLINEMIRQNPLHTFEDLAPLSINELKLISESENLTLENTQSSGTASDKAFIGAQAAIDAAKAHAGVTEIFNLECELDSERGIIVYEVEFRTADGKYEYDVNAKDGSIVKSQVKTNNGNGSTSQPPQNPPSPGSGSQTPSQPTQPSTPLLTAATAKEKAFAHAGVNPEEVWDLECELDHDDGTVKYEIDFKANGYEYEYDVEAYSGNILKFDKERDD